MNRNNMPVKVGLLELLQYSNGAQFVIPAYQRNYTWSAHHEVKQLFEDIISVLKGERTKHFIGIVIYLEKVLSPFISERSIIDGQQRLTTIFLTLYAIKEIMEEKNMHKEAEALENMYLLNQYNEKNKYKLKPLVSDDTVYQQIVSGNIKDVIDRKSKVYINYIYIKNIIHGLTERFRINDILLAMDKLYIVCVPIGEDDYPQKIFESINATGAKLTASDLIRNFILMPIASDLQDKYYEDYWKKIEILVESDSKKLEAFFRYFIMAKDRMLVNKNAVYRSFTNWYENNIDKYGDEGIFREIVKYAKYYNDIYKAPIEDLDIDLRQPIRELRMILSDMPVPLLLELYGIYKKDKVVNLSAKQLGYIINILNSYLMRRSLCGMDTSDISAYFPELLREILNDCKGDFSNIVEIFKRDLINRNKGTKREMPDDKRLLERIKNANMYGLRQSVKVFFCKMESENNPAPVDFSKLNIEHLMPQTPTANWFTELQITREIYEENLHRLGNLTLAAKIDNSRMGNKVWDYKNRVLASTNHLKINYGLLNKREWTIKDINERTLELINKITELYPYYEVKGSFVDKIPIYIQEGEILALANYYPDDGSVEIETGSGLSIDSTQDSSLEIDEFRLHLLDQKVISYEGGNLKFISNYVVHSKSDNAANISAKIILAENKNGMDCWMTENGKTLGNYLNDFKMSDNSLAYKVSKPQKSNYIYTEKNTADTSNMISPISGLSSADDIFILEKKIDWSLLTAGLTIPLNVHEIFQNLKGGPLEFNEKRDIVIILDNIEYDALLIRTNYDGRPNGVMQIRYTSNSLIAQKLRKIYRKEYTELANIRYCKKRGIMYDRYSVNKYLAIYATDRPDVYKFECEIGNENY